jgi:hypothetical protein
MYCDRVGDVGRVIRSLGVGNVNKTYSRELHVYTAIQSPTHTSSCIAVPAVHVYTAIQPWAAVRKAVAMSHVCDCL